MLIHRHRSTETLTGMTRVHNKKIGGQRQTKSTLIQTGLEGPLVLEAFQSVCIVIY